MTFCLRKYFSTLRIKNKKKNQLLNGLNRDMNKSDYNVLVFYILCIFLFNKLVKFKVNIFFIHLYVLFFNNSTKNVLIIDTY